MVLWQEFRKIIFFPQLKRTKFKPNLSFSICYLQMTHYGLLCGANLAEKHSAFITEILKRCEFSPSKIDALV